jgi:site-specific recombinase XerD
MMVYASGLRVSEVVALKRQDIDCSRKAVLVSAGKGRKDRYTLLSDAVMRSLESYYAHSEYNTWVSPVLM